MPLPQEVLGRSRGPNPERYFFPPWTSPTSSSALSKSVVEDAHRVDLGLLQGVLWEALVAIVTGVFNTRNWAGEMCFEALATREGVRGDR